jgi:hypothetical protein
MLTKETLIDQGIDENVASEIIEKIGDKAESFVPKKAANDLVNRAYSNVDRAILTRTKIPKESNEMTSDYALRALSEMTDATKTEYEQKINEMTTNIENLKSKIKDGHTDEEVKSMLESAQRERDEYRQKYEKFDKILAEKENEWSEKYKQKEGEYETFKKKSAIKASIPTNFREDLSAKYRAWLVDNAIDEVLENFDKIEQDENGKLVLKNTEKFTSVNASEYFADKFKDDLDTRQATGGGGKGSETQIPPSLNLPADMPKGEKYQKIKEHVIGMNIPVTSQEFSEKIKELSIQNGLIETKKK